MQYIHCCISRLTFFPYFSALTKRKVNHSNINIFETSQFKELWGLLKILLLRNEYRDPPFYFSKVKDDSQSVLRSLSTHRFHCHAIKKSIENYPVEKAKNLGYYSR